MRSEKFICNQQHNDVVVLLNVLVALVAIVHKNGHPHLRHRHPEVLLTPAVHHVPREVALSDRTIHALSEEITASG